MKKLVRAVEPYRHPHGINFKTKAFEAWVKAGGQVAESHYPPRWAHHFAYRYELPTIWKNKKEARLRFVEPVSISFDTFPDYCRHEIIPFIWDCWPHYFEKVCAWFVKHQVRTAFITSSQTAERLQERFSAMNILYVPEGIDTSLYGEGKRLSERTIDLLEFGRSNEKVFKVALPETIKHVCTKVNEEFIYTNEQLYDAMGDAKLTITLPRSMTHPEIAGDIETLTQRYWECMLSRMVMLGHAPKELVDLIGYNPVVELDVEHTAEQVQEILAHIEDYQPLVDKNRKTALKMGDWYVRMQEVMKWLKDCGYEV